MSKEYLGKLYFILFQFWAKLIQPSQSEKADTKMKTSPNFLCFFHVCGLFHFKSCVNFFLSSLFLKLSTFLGLSLSLRTFHYNQPQSIVFLAFHFLTCTPTFPLSSLQEGNCNILGSCFLLMAPLCIYIPLEASGTD